ncbi:MAG: hypothetical protein ACKVS9_04935 [Phycisphaerae bacterium]
MKRLFANLILGALGTAATLAGDLNPPVGPVAPTMKTLVEIEPRIAISAANTPGDANSSFRIVSPGSYYVCASLVGDSGKHGIEVAADGVTIDLNGFALTGVAGSLAGISADNSVRHRVHIYNGAVVGWGLDGISVTLGDSSGMLVERVRAADISGDGISVARDSHIRACVAEQNGADGISVYYGSMIMDCIAAGNGASGISTLGACVIRGCTARANEYAGINAFEDGLIESCAVVSNLGDGNVVGYDCVVRGNLATGNGQGAAIGAGIAVGQFLRGNRIEDNQVNGNDFGLKVDGDNNFIVRNTARGNTSGNFSVVAGNELAPVITNPGSSGFASMTPWSNVAY